MWRRRFVVHSGQDAAKVLQHCSLGHVTTLPRRVDKHRVLHQQIVGLSSRRFIERPRCIVHFCQQTLGSIQMVRYRRICWLCCEWSMSVDSEVWPVHDLTMQMYSNT